jgi:hypothetical protein
MTVHDERDTARTPIVPSPRSAQDAPTDEAARPGGEFPWPEPWHRSRGARPRSEFWDVETASWRSRGPVPPQRFRV